MLKRKRVKKKGNRETEETEKISDMYDFFYL
jgi:hypothetical protein